MLDIESGNVALTDRRTVIFPWDFMGLKSGVRG